MRTENCLTIVVSLCKRYF